MHFANNWNRLIAARVVLLLPLLLAASSLQSFAQTSADVQLSQQGTNKPYAKCPGDLSRWPGLLIGLEGGSGRSSLSSPFSAAYGGLKIGGSGLTLDFGYDHVPSHHGFAIEGSAMLPVLRLPRA